MFSHKKSLANDWQLHPFCQQRAIVSYCRTNNIVISAYCPLVRNLKASNEIIVSIAKKHSVSTNQVLVRYSLQKGWNPLPKSDTPERIEQNADVFGFELDEENMKALDELDEGDRGALVEAVVN